MQTTRKEFEMKVMKGLRTLKQRVIEQNKLLL
jgi:hypothetical protein